MGSCSLWRAGLDAKLARLRAVPVHLRGTMCVLATCVSATGVVLGPAVAEAAAPVDAGQPSGIANPRTRDLATPALSAGSFQKAMAPSHLPESVQRRLRERAGQNPSMEPVDPPPAEPPRALSETARRIGEARMRRVQAFDTGKGVTILSNRFSELPNPTPVAARAPGAMSPREGETVVAPPPLTATRSLRAAGTSTPMPRSGDWFWPLAALLGVSAGLGTLLYRKTWSGKLLSSKARHRAP